MKRAILIFVLFLLSAINLPAANWVSLGPEGGDARSLTFDPSNPDRVYLGTSAGELFLSTDGGSSWSRYAHLGSGYNYVVDSVVVNPKDPATMYAGVWSVESNGGDVFKSTDRGQTWQALPGIHGKSIRAMALAPADPNAIAVGALDGVYRSLDAGNTWEKITPASNPELKNFESIAFDPRSTNVVYAGTWHLPWKTEDGGRTWDNIKNGIIDDSDVFSIIVDPKNPAVVYASACSGIYKSDSAGKQFRKVQGIPFSARRTRVLQQDPVNGDVVFAGTTEGLWKTKDGGTSWARVSPANYIVNDVLVDPRHPESVLLATDRTGVLMSHDGGNTFRAANRGFSHRQVTSLVVDHKDPARLYASLINNREFGGVYFSSNDGVSWAQFNEGLGSRDIFSLAQSPAGELVAGTNQGIFALDRQSQSWKPINVTLREKVITVPLRHPKKGKPKTTIRREWVKGQITGRVAQLKISAERWLAATSQGLYRSLDQGKSWTGGPVLGQVSFIAVDSSDDLVLGAGPTEVLLSSDGANTWSQLKLPNFVSRISNVALGPKDELWILTHMGAFRSKDSGRTWEHAMAGTPLANFSFVGYDREGERLLGTAGSHGQIYESKDGGDTWTLAADAQYPVRNVAISRGRMLAVTEFNGVLAETTPQNAQAAAGGGN